MWLFRFASAELEEEDKDEDDEEVEGEEGRGKQNRNEKKARKAILKMGMKPVPGVNRIMVKKNKSTLFIITKPDVYKAAGSDTYVIFGEARMDDSGAQQQQAAAEQFRAAASDRATAAASRVGAGPAADAGDDAEGSVDETGLEAKDIELVMSQANVSRGKAVGALKRNEGDIVNAIMELTT